MSTRRVVLLACDTCGEIFDHGNHTVSEALSEARHEGWERKPSWSGRNSYTWDDECGVCTGKYVRTPMGFLVPATEADS